ncbi:MAG: Ig-like domain-containing protein [Eubacterium sp.]|nr:Ig-like domain-containing protein [Eubacterium sp.]
MSNKIKNLAVVSVVWIWMSAAFTQQVPAAMEQERLAGSSMETADVLQLPEDADSQPEDLQELTAGVRAKENTRLPAPEKVTQEKLAYNLVTLGWTGVEGAAGYQVEYAAGEGSYTVAGTTDAQTLSYQCKGLVTGTSYQFRVCALDESGSLGDYAQITVQPVLKKTNFTYAGVTQAQKALLEWKKVAGAMNYELYRKAPQQSDYELLAVTAELSYTDETVTAGGSYSYQVRAIRDENGTTVRAKFSDEAKVSLSAAAMRFESCEAVNYQSVKLTWHQDTAATGYYIYRSVKENGTYRKIKTITKNTLLTYTDTKLVPGKKFYYKICTYTKKADGTVASGEPSDAVQALTQANAPELVAAKTNLANRSVSLEWKKAEQASGYRIYRSAYPDRGFAKVKDVTGGTFVGYEDRSVIPGGTYYYRIKTIYVNGSYKGLSAASNSLEGHVAPSAPIGLAITQTGEDTLKVSWNMSIGAASYNLYRANAPAAEYECIAQGLTETEYTDDGVAEGKTCYYRVSAVGAAGEGLMCYARSFRVGGVSLNTRTLKLCVGVTKPLKVSTYLEGDTEWKSANTDIATVDEEGNVTGVAYGTVAVTATVDGQSASATVSVTPGSKNGIDVSRWQEDVDWSRVKESGVEFAFLRISNHNLADYTFETKYQNAFSVGMPMGVYCYSRATTVEEAQEEARIVLETLNGRKLDYPIAFDLEDAVHKAKTMKKETLHQMIQAFKQVVEDAGYRFVLYSYVTFLNTYLDKTKLDGIDLWVARYRNVSLGTGYSGKGNVKYWQYNSGQYNGSNSQVDGITKDTGELVSVDVNVEYE